MSLASAVLSLSPLEGQLPGAIRLQGSGLPDADHALLQTRIAPITRMFRAAGLRDPAYGDTAKGLSAFDKVATAALAAAAVEPIDLLDPVAAIAQARLRGLPACDVSGVGSELSVTHQTVMTPDGVGLRIVRAGASTAVPVMIFGPPGIPPGVLAGWLQRIGAERRVATWETRGLFGPGLAAEMPFGSETHAGDAAAILDALGWQEVHLIGFCGGAALSLGFAACHTRRVRSLALLFGDYELGTLAQKSIHQKNLHALMNMVVCRQVSATQLHSVLLQAALKMSEPDLAPFAMYPYANPRLLERYCHINHSIMSTDWSACLSAICKPTLVGYDPRDETVHPEGSRTVAERLDARLEAFSGSGHLGAFRGRPADVERVLAFIREHDAEPDASAGAMSGSRQA